MSDPLSIAASVASLVALALQSTEYLYNYYTACQYQHESLGRITDRLDALLNSLGFIDEIVRTRTWRPSELTIVQSIESSVTHSEDIIQLLQDEVDKFKKESINGWTKKAVVVGRRAAYPFTRRTIEGLGNDVNEFRNNLSIAIQALQLKEHQNIQDDIAGIHTIMKSTQVHNISTDIRDWLQAPDATINLNIASAKRHSGTGEWLVQGPIFASWLHQDNSFLWLYGFAGCGKSVLCSTVIQDASRRRQLCNYSAVAFFFFTFNDESKKDVSAALRALLFQLCGQVPGLEADLNCLKQSSNHGTPSVPTLRDHLRQAITRCLHVYILLDALDKSPLGSIRDEVVSTIETIRQWQLPELHLLVTSRDIPDIRDQILSQGGYYVPLKNDSVQQDISRYISFQVDNDRQLQRWGSHREKIKSYLTQHADGVFRWVECQLGPPRQCAHSEKHLEQFLRALPRSLDETYERILCSIESREEPRRILSLLSFASRPLLVDEVIEALAVDINDLKSYDPKSRLADGADDLLRICPELISISFDSGISNDGNHKFSYEDYRNDKLQKSHSKSLETVRIARFSVQEYLLSNRIKRSPACDFALSKSTEHARISQSCLLYLDYDNYSRQSFRINQDECYAFESYAARYWYHHYHQAEEYLAEQLLEKIVALFTTPQKRARWLEFHNPDLRRDGLRYHEYSKVARDSHVLLSPVYCASLLGLDRVLARILSMSTANVNAREGNDGNALHVASARRHVKTVQILLDAGALVDVKEKENNTALHMASLFGHEEVVQILLDAGAHVDAKGDGEYTALQGASRTGHEKVVRLLLGAGANINDIGGWAGSALQEALSSDHEKIVRLLLDAGADANAESSRHCTALETAVVMAQEDIIQMLLDTGADVNAHGGAALKSVSHMARDNVVQMLLDAGANVNAPDENGRTALIAATSGRYLISGTEMTRREKIIQLLVDAGADANAKAKNGCTALLASAARGRKNIVQILLKAGADVNAQGGEYSSALQAALAMGNDHIADILRVPGATEPPMVSAQSGIGSMDQI